MQKKHPNIKTLEELVETCKIDLDKWQVNEFCVEKTDSGDAPKFRLRANFERKNPITSEKLLEIFSKNAQKYSPKTFNSTQYQEKGDKLYLINLFDVHLAKYAWGKQVGEDYDIKIASNLYNKAIDYFCGKIKNLKIDRILFPIGNDFFNYDREGSAGGKGDGGTLTKAGTIVESDSRWQKMFAIGCELITDAIDRLSQMAPVDILIIPGNHDETITQYLGYYLKAWYKNNTNVKIDNSPKIRKYYIYGKNLLGFTHSNFEKSLKDLPLIMSKEMEREWGRTTVKDWYCGHWHHERLEELNGVRVRVCPAITSTDNFHFKKGFVGNHRGGQGFLYEKSGGLIDIHYFNIPNNKISK